VLCGRVSTDIHEVRVRKPSGCNNPYTQKVCTVQEKLKHLQTCDVLLHDKYFAIFHALKCCLLLMFWKLLQIIILCGGLGKYCINLFSVANSQISKLK
jgi:hypothetical protein